MLILTSMLLLVASIYDIKYRKIPNALIILLLLIGLFSVFYFGSSAQKLIGFIFPSILLLIPYMHNKAGAGDVKLIAATGLILGVSINTLVFFFSLVFVLLFNMIISGLNKKPGTTVPFSPFVYVGLVFFMLIALLNQHFRI